SGTQPILLREVLNTDNDNATGGRGALVLLNTRQYGITLQQKVQIPSTGNYTLRGWVRTNVRPDQGVVRFGYKLGSGQSLALPIKFNRNITAYAIPEVALQTADVVSIIVDCQLTTSTVDGNNLLWTRISDVTLVPR